jgi:hypothetical protein
MRNCVILFYTCREKSFADSVWVQGPEENRERKEEEGVTRDLRKMNNKLTLAFWSLNVNVIVLMGKVLGLQIMEARGD